MQSGSVRPSDRTTRRRFKKHLIGCNRFQMMEPCLKTDFSPFLVSDFFFEMDTGSDLQNR